MKNPLKISVVVPIFEQWHLIDSLFCSLSRQNFPGTDWEFILVDNGSKSIPDFDNPVENFQFEVCSQAGSYAARNFGLGKAKGELIVFTDADCIPCESWLSQLWAKHESNVNGGGDAVIAGGVEMRGADSYAPTTSELYDILFGLPQEQYVRRGYAVTANLSIPREIFKSVGPFNQQKLSGGDSEFCHRARASGAKLQFLKTAYVVHPARRKRSELVTKIRRVKGGQMSNIALAKRLKYGVATFLPPFSRFTRVMKASNLSFSQKRDVGVLLFQLYCVGIYEFVRLLLGGKPERR